MREFIDILNESNNQWPDRTAKQWADLLPLAGPVVSGLRVENRIDNLGSIRASFTDYFILPGIREYRFSVMGGVQKEGYPSHRVRDLMAQIAENKMITPLIVAIDSWNGPYILEGAHRIDALIHMGIESYPALIVFDDSDDHWDNMWDDEHDALGVTQ